MYLCIHNYAFILWRWSYFGYKNLKLISIENNSVNSVKGNCSRKMFSK